MYYLDDMSQAEIAERLMNSRSQVSRYLKRAREAGLVEVKLNPPSNENLRELENRIKDILNLGDVIIAPVLNPVSPTEEEIIRAIASAGSDYLAPLIVSSSIVGIGWGNTVYATVLAMKHGLTASNTTFVPLIGGIGQTEPYYQVNTFIDRLTEKFHAKTVFLNAPALLSDKRIYKEELSKDNVTSIINMWKMIDIAVIGLGGPVVSSGVLRSSMDTAIVVKLLSMNAVGDILARFFDESGRICNSGLESHILGISLKLLSEVKRVVCLAGGKKKTKAIITAAKAAYFNILVTDEHTAVDILKTVEVD